jgi:hypothetical protein
MTSFWLEPAADYTYIRRVLTNQARGLRTEVMTNSSRHRHKTGGRQKGTPNKAKAELKALVDAAKRIDGGLPPAHIATMMPVDIMLYAMRIEADGGRWRTAAAIAEKAAPYFHAKMAPKTDETGEAGIVIIKVTGGLPE